MKNYLILLAAGFLFLLSLRGVAQSTAKPNIIIILADDLGWGDVGFHGSNISTPNIDGLSKEGVILNHYYNAPICSPTRSGIMTGRYPNRFGLRATVIPPWSSFGVDTTEEFLPQMLAQAGYKNRAALGKWHLGHSSQKYLPLQRGFTHFYGHYNGALDYFTHLREGELDWHNGEQTSYDKGYTTDLVTDEAVKCIKKYKASPFFLYVAYNAPHGPLQAKKEDLLLYGYDESKGSYGKEGANEEGATETAQGRGNTRRQTYEAMVTCLDRGVGRILQELKEQGLEKNTLIIFTSDNGAAPNEGGSSGGLRGLKFQEWDGGVRSPAIVRWPAAFKGGRTINQVMGYVDLAPTIREITGLSAKPPKPYDGLSMLSIWKGLKQTINRDLYLGFGSMVNNEWKLVRANAGNPKMENKEDMLFRIATDTSETTNVKTQFSAEYDKMLKKVKPFDEIQPSIQVPPFGQGKNKFKAPKEWKIIE
jgi:arylsulfatase B